MTVEPTCRFCMGKMVPCGTRERPTGNPYPDHYITVAYLYLCKKCHSEQAFALDGRTLDYNFRVENYRLYFYPQGSKFVIKQQEDYYQETVLVELETCPGHLKPSNTTEARIKTLILFS